MAGQIIGIDHLGVNVKDPRERLSLWADLLGLPLEKVEDVASEGVRTWFLDAGGAHIELLEALGENSPVTKQIEKRGEGLAHLALRVDDIDAVLARAASKGVAPVGGGVRTGAGGAKVAFLHPKDTGGILLELCEREDHHEAFEFDEDDLDDEEPFGAGTVGVLYLREPRERLFGVIRQLDTVGVALEGLDLEMWEPWISQWSRGADGPLSPSLQFFPLARVEKILADGDTPEVPSFTRQFEERTGRPLAEAFGLELEDPAGDPDEDMN